MADITQLVNGGATRKYKDSGDGTHAPTVAYAGPSWTTVWGIAGVPFTSADQHSAAASVSDAPTSGQKLVIDEVIISVDTTMNVTLKCETTGAVVAGPFYVLANNTLHVRPRGKGWKLATADKKLQAISSVSGNISVYAGYHSEA